MTARLSSGGNSGATAGMDERFGPLWKLVKKHRERGGLTLEVLCDKLRIPPAEARKLVAEAIKAGLDVTVHNGELELASTHQPRVPVEVISRRQKPGEEITIGVFSDIHVCSSHFERQAATDHLQWLVDSGVRDVFCPGDLVTGGYRFLKYEVTHTGIHAQSEQFAEFVRPWLGQLSFHCIAGNHDESFDVGIDASKYTANLLRSKHFTYYGARGARLLYRGTRIEMHHPGGGLGYAMSYKIQRHIDNTARDDRAHILLTGHTHQALHIQRAGTHGFLCGTFENGDSSFGRMLGGDVALGSWLLRYSLDENGGVARMNATFAGYPQTKMRYVTAA